MVALDAAAAFDRNSLVAAMGSVTEVETEETVAAEAKRLSAPIVVEARPAKAAGGLALAAHRGEVVGLAGLSGQGQTELLVRVFDHAAGDARCERPRRAGRRRPPDRRHLSAVVDRREHLDRVAAPVPARGLLIDHRRARAFAEDWRERIGIRTPDMDNPILSLSGGNQQKALFARALGADAPIILMDDPMRGVDVGTKQEVYAMIRAEAARGRTFLWYTTEMDELRITATTSMCSAKAPSSPILRAPR